MAIDKGLSGGSTAMLVLKLIEGKDMYGYEMTEELKRRSDDTFSLKAGTLYPLLHSLEESGHVRSYEAEAGGRQRKYYAITEAGRRLLGEKRAEWVKYSAAVNKIMEGGLALAAV